MEVESCYYKININSWLTDTKTMHNTQKQKKNTSQSLAPNPCGNFCNSGIHQLILDDPKSIWFAIVTIISETDLIPKYY